MKQNRNVSYLNQNKTKLNYVIKFSLIECSLFITLTDAKFSQQRNIKCLTEERRKNCQKKQFSCLQFYSFNCSSRCSSSKHIHHPCLKPIPFLFFSRDHLPSTMGIICGPRSFPIHFGDHLQCEDHLRFGIICDTVQISCH